jgi:hypothetical protein
MAGRSLRAPVASGSILAEPDLARVDALIDRNRALVDAWRYDFQGRSSAQLRAMARSAVLAAGQSRESSVQSREPEQSPETRGEHRDSHNRPSSEAERLSPDADSRRSTLNARLSSGPFIVSGHQPELFHPGVWVKNFASFALARRRAGVSLHLVVDNDTVKGITKRIPTGTPERPSVVHVPLDRWRGEVPYEEYAVQDEAVFRPFGARVTEAVASLGIRPLAEQFWPMVLAESEYTPRLGERIARGRRRCEAAWGCENLELPVSRLCQTEAFYWFTCHVLAQLPRFRAEYNGALEAYRLRNHIRSHNHPVPALESDGDWLEAPFWVWTAAAPERRRLFARQADRHRLLLSDHGKWQVELPLGPDREACCAVEQLAALAERGIKIRTRALTTTLFARLCLADLFIHGLGGARYDELSDEVIRGFFGIAPPGFLTLTGTLHLPLPHRARAIERVRTLERLVRDLRYNPDRHLERAPESGSARGRLVREKQELIRAVPRTRAERHERFEVIRRVNGELAPHVEQASARATRELAAARAAVRADTILEARDWPFCVYPEETLRAFFAQVLEPVLPSV